MFLARDVTFTLRTLSKSPSFTVVAVLTLALGIGASTAIFTVVDQTLLRALPFEESERLVYMHHHPPGEPDVFLDVSYPDFLDWKAHTTSFTALAAVPVTAGRAFVDVEGEPVGVGASPVSAELFSVLGATPLLGRDFTADDDRVGAEPVTLIGFRLWQRLFGGAPSVLGSSLEVNGIAHRVIGVMPRGFEYPVGSELWTPLVPVAPELIENRSVAFLQIVGRLRDGSSFAEARDDVQRVVDEVTSKSWTTKLEARAAVVPLREHLVGDAEPAILVLFGASGLLLLIACANVANLLVARGTGRRQELALRRALGADTLRLVRELLVEGAVLAAAGGASGLVLAKIFLDELIRTETLRLFRFGEIGLDPRAVGFACAASLGTVLLFALLPALQHARATVHVTTRAPRRGRLGAALVVAEVSLALFLLIGSGLLVESFLNLSRVDTGFEAKEALTLQLVIPTGLYEEPSAWRGLFERLVERVEALPGVASAAGMLLRPLESPQGYDYTLTIEGQALEAHQQNPLVNYQAVTDAFFGTTGLRLREGRSFTAADREETQPVVIVSDALARRYWPRESAVGKRLKWGPPDSEAPWLTVIGVANDARFRGITNARLDVYVPHRQNPWRLGYVVVRSEREAPGLVPAIRREARAIDPQLRVASPHTLEEMVAGALSRPRFNTLLLGLFAAAATLLGAIGVYGSMSFEAASKRREIGIRMALGASRPSVAKLILKRALVLILPGIVVGLVAAAAGTRVLESLLYQVSTWDARTFLAVPVGLILVGVLAAVIPARRAASADPVQSLRAD